MHDDVRALERRPQRVLVPHVPLAVLELVHPRGRVEGPAGDADDARDVVVGLQQRHQAGPKVPVGPVTATVRPAVSREDADFHQVGSFGVGM